MRHFVVGSRLCLYCTRMSNAMKSLPLHSWNFMSLRAKEQLVRKSRNRMEFFWFGFMGLLCTGLSSLVQHCNAPLYNQQGSVFEASALVKFSRFLSDFLGCFFASPLPLPFCFVFSVVVVVSLGFFLNFFFPPNRGNLLRCHK